MHLSERGNGRTVTPKTRHKNGVSAKGQRQARATRKPKKASSSELSELDEDLNGDVFDDAGDDSGDDMHTTRQRRADPSRSALKRKRTATTSTTTVPSTRVLRTRVPKKIETLKAEKEAEAAYRRAIED